VKYDAIVIGAGPNGLTAAAMLAKGGRKTLVLESAAETGGHTRAIEFAPGFRAPLSDDCGWVPPKVSKALGLSLDDVAPELATSVVTPDGRLISLSTNAQAAAREIATLSATDAARWPAFVERLGKFAAILGDLYQLTPPDIDTRSIGEVLPMLGVGRRLRGMGRDDMIEFLRVMPMSAQDLLDDTFQSEPLKAAIAAAALRDIRQGPRSGGTTFNLLHYLVGAPAGSVRARSWFREGPDAFARKVADIARRNGVEIRTGATVGRIVVRDGRVTGVTIGAEQIEAPLVISTADPKTTVRLVDPVWLDPEFMLAVKNVKLRGCTAFVLFAVDGAIVHERRQSASMVSTTPDTTALERAADAAKYRELSTEPHVEFFTPTLRWPQLAQSGKHVVTARVQFASYDLAWSDAHLTTLKEKATAAIGRVIPGFEASIVHRVALSPRDIEERFGVTEGALTQGELTLDQILFMRPVPGWGHYRWPVDGLYLGGAGAHPGPGVLGGAGYLAARAALK
jgi:phytoene dehydrogenase-like protein